MIVIFTGVQSISFDSSPLLGLFCMFFLFIHWPAVNLYSVLLCLVTFNQQTSSNHRRLNQHLLSFSLHPHSFTFNNPHSSLSPVPSSFCSPAASRSFTDSSQIIEDGRWWHLGVLCLRRTFNHLSPQAPSLSLSFITFSSWKLPLWIYINGPVHR